MYIYEHTYSVYALIGESFKRTNMAGNTLNKFLYTQSNSI